MNPRSHPVGPGQESVWAYPRPAIAEASPAHIMIEHRGIIVADTRASIRTLETSHPPSYYIPPADIAPGVLRRGSGSSFCEWKGAAIYWDVAIGDVTVPGVGWSYPQRLKICGKLPSSEPRRRRRHDGKRRVNRPPFPQTPSHS